MENDVLMDIQPGRTFEIINEELPPEVLLRVKTILLEADICNRNNRIYSKKLILDKILNSPYTHEMLENKTLYGEAVHPDERIMIDTSRACLNVSKMWWNEDINALEGVLDILATPFGHIIATLLKYGSKLGISVRSTGKVKPTAYGNEVEYNSYIFKCFDITTYPGSPGARMKLLKEEASEVVKVLQEQIKNLSPEEKDAVKKILEEVENPEVQEVKENIEAPAEQEPEIQPHGPEVVADNSAEEAKAVAEKVTELEEANTKTLESLHSAEQQVTDLEAGIQELKTKNEELILTLDTLNSNNIVLENQVRDLTANLETSHAELKTLTDAYEIVNSEKEEAIKTISELRETVANLESNLTTAVNSLEEFKSKQAEKYSQEPQVEPEQAPEPEQSQEPQVEPLKEEVSTIRLRNIMRKVKNSKISLEVPKVPPISGVILEEVKSDNIPLQKENLSGTRQLLSRMKK